MNLVAAVVTVAFMVFLLTRPIGSPTDPAPLLILGEEQLQEEAAKFGLDEGRVAPGFEVGEGSSLGLTGVDGRRLNLADLSGRPVWIVFWATYCHASEAIGTPTHYFVDRDGRIASRAFGRLELTEMEAHLAGILKPAP